MVPEVLVYPYTSHIKGIGIGAEYARKEKSHSKSSSAVSLDSSFPRSVEILCVISHFFFFLPISSNYTDSIKSLIGISCTLAVGFHILLRTL
jgi:hypothetical protein